MTPKTLFIAQGDLDWGSSRFRAWWVAAHADWAECVTIDNLLHPPGLVPFERYKDDPPLAWARAGVTELEWQHEFDTVVLPKWTGAAAQAFAQAIRERDKRIIWDLCDPLWWLEPRGFAAMLPLVDYLVFSNARLEAAFCGEYDDRRTAVIPDRMEPAFHPTVKEHAPTPAPVLLWWGYGWNRAALLSAGLGLQRLVGEGARFRLRVLDDGAPGGVSVPGVDVEYHRWRRDTFHDELLAADVALLPPYPGVWGALKSDNKAVSAWWAGLPVVDLQSADDVDRAQALIADADLRAREGWANRKRASEQYDVRQSVRDWENVLQGVMG